MAVTTTPASRRLPRHFWLLWVGTFVNRAATFVAPFLMLFLTGERGLAATTAGVVLAVQGGGLALSNLIGGWLADRWGRRNTMLAGLSLTAVIVLILPEVRNLWLVVALVGALGLVADLHRPALNALVADAVPEEDRTRAYSLLHWAINLGMSVAMVGGGVLSEIGFAWLFRFDAVATAAFAVLIWRLLPAGPEVAAAPSADASSAVDWWRNGRLLAFVSITAVVFGIYFQNYVTLPLAVTATGLTPRDFGVMLAVNGIAVAVLQPLLANHLGRLRPSGALVGAYLLIGAGYGLVAIAGDLLSLAGTVLLWSLGEIVLVAVGSAFVVALAPAHARGRYLGVYGAAIASSAAVAPLAGTTIYAWNSTVLWVGCFVLTLIASVVQLMLRPAAPAAAPETVGPLVTVEEKA
ncbi:MFS transporter [Micromonospora sp. NPDC007271]|uniref:MFS transporter n=1 Tax=Micromonospora sp. NPDC007271 TaxID=3154587 RepID=UPI0033E43CAC